MKNECASATFVCLLVLLVPFFHISVKNTTTLDIYFEFPI